MINIEVKDNKLIITADLEAPKLNDGSLRILATTRGTVKTEIVDPVTNKPINVALLVFVDAK